MRDDKLSVISMQYQQQVESTLLLFDCSAIFSTQYAVLISYVHVHQLISEYAYIYHD